MNFHRKKRASTRHTGNRNKITMQSQEQTNG